MFKSFLCFPIFIVIFQSNIELIQSAKCSNINRPDGYKYVECKTVSAMEDLANQMHTNWNNLHIVNRAGVSFLVSRKSRRLFVSIEKLKPNVIRFRLYILTEHTNDNLGFVKKLDLSCAGKLETDQNGFRDFTSLNTLRLKKNKLTVIQRDWFDAENNLQYLDASRNDITTVQRDDLQNLGQLIFLNLANNKIRTIELESFANLSNLTRLIVSHNKLNEFSADLPNNLKQLYLNGNLLTNVRHPEIFKSQ